MVCGCPTTNTIMPAGSLPAGGLHMLIYADLRNRHSPVDSGAIPAILTSPRPQTF